MVIKFKHDPNCIFAIKQWEGISANKTIADVNLRTKKIEGTQKFKECITTMATKPKSCLRKKCIIALLIRALQKRGAQL